LKSAFNFLTRSNRGDGEGSSLVQQGDDFREQMSWLRIVRTSGVCSANADRPSELQNVKIEPSDPSQPGVAERAIDTATDVSRTLTEVSAALQAAVGRLSDAITAARQPGMPLSTISAITREAPLASLCIAFLFGVAIARRR
jgi:hypothetical protein